jgi:hypothetical protein
VTYSRSLEYSAKLTRKFERFDETHGPFDQSQTTSQFSWSNTKFGSQNPHWRAQIQAHQSATTPFSGVMSEMIGPSEGYARRKIALSSSSTKLWDEYVYSGVLGFPVTPTDPASLSSSTADSEALVEFYESVRDANRSFQGGQFLGELAETLHLIKNPVLSFRRGLDAYYRTVRNRSNRYRPPRRRTPRQRLVDRTRIVQDTWLEYSFGWKPLLFDAQDAYETLTRKSRAFADGDLITVFGHSEQRSVSVSTVLNNGTNTSWSYDRRFENVVSVRYKGQVWGRPFRSSLGDARLWGVDLTAENLLPTAWELIPYSFLVDYFTNVGDVFSSFSTCTSNLAWKVRTIKAECDCSTVNFRLQPFSDPSRVISESISGSYIRYVRKSVSRSDPSLGTPGIIFKLPGSNTKWLNIGGLARLRR